jgi:diguanylate cyclase (GGDEF)-like protein
MTLHAAHRRLEAHPYRHVDDAMKVLVVEDDEECLEGLAEVVEGFGYACRRARDGAEAWALHQVDHADVILSDWNMPRMSGVELCGRVRGEDPEKPYTHFVFVTSNARRAEFLDAMQAGADDYVVKPIDVDELRVRLEAIRRVVIRQRQLREKNSSLRRDRASAHALARTDSLTRALNRRALKEDLDVLAARAARYGHRYSAALSDIDHFKSYNDHFGHLPGDRVLALVARTIRRELRRGDVLYRYGGEEFLAILPEQRLDEASRGMERVRRAVEALRIPAPPHGDSPFVTISTGISLMRLVPEETMESWIERADRALYAAKTRGRNRVVVEETLGDRDRVAGRAVG